MAKVVNNIWAVGIRKEDDDEKKKSKSGNTVNAKANSVVIAPSSKTNAVGQAARPTTGTSAKSTGNVWAKGPSEIVRESAKATSEDQPRQSAAIRELVDWMNGLGKKPASDQKTSSEHRDAITGLADWNKKYQRTGEGAPTSDRSYADNLLNPKSSVSRGASAEVRQRALDLTTPAWYRIAHSKGLTNPNLTPGRKDYASRNIGNQYLMNDAPAIEETWEQAYAEGNLGRATLNARDQADTVRKMRETGRWDGRDPQTGSYADLKMLSSAQLRKMQADYQEGVKTAESELKKYVDGKEQYDTWAAQHAGVSAQEWKDYSLQHHSDQEKITIYDVAPDEIMGYLRNVKHVEVDQFSPELSDQTVYQEYVDWYNGGGLSSYQPTYMVAPEYDYQDRVLADWQDRLAKVNDELDKRDKYASYVDQAQADPEFAEKSQWAGVPEDESYGGWFRPGYSNEGGYLNAVLHTNKEGNLNRIYNTINDSRRMSSEIMSAGMNAGTSNWILDHGYHLMTPEEKATFNYWYNHDPDHSGAQAFLDIISDDLLARRAAGLEAYQKGLATDPITAGPAFVARSVANLAGGMMAPIQVGAAIANPGISSKNPVFDYTNMARTVSSAQQQAIADSGIPILSTPLPLGNGTWGTLAYGVISSAIDSWMGVNAGTRAAQTLGMGEKTAKALAQMVMSSEATSNALVDNIENGLDPRHAICGAIASGITEAITERYSIEALMGDPTRILPYMAKNVIAEGSEEAASNILYTAYDLLANGDKAAPVLEYRQLTQMGVGHKEAEKTVLRNWLTGLLDDAVAGSLSGGVMGGGAYATNAAAEASLGRKINAGQAVFDVEENQQNISARGTSAAATAAAIASERTEASQDSQTAGQEEQTASQEEQLTNQDDQTANQGTQAPSQDEKTPTRDGQKGTPNEQNATPDEQATQDSQVTNQTDQGATSGHEEVESGADRDDTQLSARTDTDTVAAGTVSDTPENEGAKPESGKKLSKRIRNLIKHAEADKESSTGKKADIQRTLTDIGLTMSHDSEAYDTAFKADERLKGGKSLTNRQTARLFTQLYAELGERNGEAIRTASENFFRSRLKEEGSDTQRAIALSRLLTKSLFGDKLTRAEAEIISKPYAQKLLRSLGLSGNGMHPALAYQLRMSQMEATSDLREKLDIVTSIGQGKFGTGTSASDSSEPAADEAHRPVGDTEEERKRVTFVTDDGTEESGEIVRISTRKMKPNNTSTKGKTFEQIYVDADQISAAAPQDSTGTQPSDGTVDETKETEAAPDASKPEQAGKAKITVAHPDNLLHQFNAALESKGAEHFDPVNEITVTVRDSSGNTRDISIDQVTDLGSDGTRGLFAYAMATTEVLESNKLNLMYQWYQGENIPDYVDAFDQVYNAGFSGYDMPASAVRMLGDTRAKSVFEQGAAYGQQTEASRLAAIKPGNGGAGSFGVLGIDMADASAVKAFRDSLDANQRAAYDTLQAMSQFIPIRIEVDNNTDETRLANGSYTRGTNVMYINLASGRDQSNEFYAAHNLPLPQYAALRTAGHELTHFLEAGSSEGYAALKRYIQGELMRRGFADFEEYVDRKMAAYAKAGVALTRGGAVSEVVADAMEMILQDSKAIQRLAHENQGLFTRVANWFSDFVANIKQAFQGVAAQSAEARALTAETGKYMDKLIQLWDTAFSEATGTHLDAALDLSEAEQAVGTLAPSVDENQVLSGDRTGFIEMPQDPVQLSTATWRDADAKPVSRRIISAMGADFVMKKRGHKNRSVVFASGRDITEATMRQHGFTEEQIRKTLAFVDDAADYMDEAQLRYHYVGLEDVNSARVTINPVTGEILLKCQVKNAEYEVNFDLGTVCKKRRALQDLFNELARRQGRKGATMLDDIELTSENIFRINQILKDEGYETACLGCFVEARRYKTKAWADRVVGEWNAMVRELNPDATPFGFARGDTDLQKLTREEEQELFRELSAISTKGTTGPTDRMRRVAAVPAMQHTLSASDLLSEQGRDRLRLFSPILDSVAQSRDGANAIKPTIAFIPYNSEVAVLPKSKRKAGKNMEMGDYLHTIGGARSQSFTDFIVTQAFDHLQKTVDLAARRLPAHTYTKELGRARLFGTTGEKINLSVMFDIDTSVGWESAGLDADGAYIVGDYINAQKQYEKTGVRAFTQSIPFEAARELEHDPRYSKNVGIIGVGYSWNHMQKMLADNDIPYIIMFHRSGMPGEVQEATHVSIATDYTPVQNTQKFAGFRKVTNMEASHGVPSFASWGQSAGKKTARSDMTFNGNGLDTARLLADHHGDAQEAMHALLDWMRANELTMETSGAEAGHGAFDLYGDLARTDNPTETANNYIAWCLENGELPLGWEFADQPGYYKMLFDFSVTDLCTGETAQQLPVSLDALLDLGSDEWLHGDHGLDHYMAAYDHTQKTARAGMERVVNRVYDTLADDSTQYKARTDAGKDNDAISVKEQIRSHLDEIIRHGKVAELDIDANQTTKKQYINTIIDDMRKKGYAAERNDGTGKVEIGRDEITKAFNRYVNTPLESASLALVYHVIKRGIVITDRKNHKDRRYDTKTIAGLVEINGEPGIMGVVIKNTGKNRYAAHRIMMLKDENTKKDAEATISVRASGKTGPLDTAITSAPGKTIASDDETVNYAVALPGVSTPRDYLMALSLDDVQGAERAILQTYQQKVKDLTAAQAVVDRFAQEMLGQTSNEFNETQKLYNQHAAAVAKRDNLQRDLARLEGADAWAGLAAKARQTMQTIQNFGEGSVQEHIGKVQERLTELDQSIDNMLHDIQGLPRATEGTAVRLVYNGKELDDAVHRIMKSNPSHVSAADLGDTIAHIGVLLQLGGQHDVENALAEADAMARRLILEEKHNVRSWELETLSDAIGRFSLSKAQMAEVRHVFGSVAAFRKALRGYAIYDPKAMRLDEKWSSIVDMSGRLVDENAGETEMPMALVEAIEQSFKAAEEQNLLSPEDVEAAAAETQAQLLDAAVNLKTQIPISQTTVDALTKFVTGYATAADAWNATLVDMQRVSDQAKGAASMTAARIRANDGTIVSGLDAIRHYYEQVSEAYIKEIQLKREQELKKKYTDQLRQLRSKAAEKTAERIQAIRTAIQNDATKRQLVQETRHARTVIRNDIMRLHKRLMQEKDDRHVPEELKGLAEALVKAFIHADRIGHGVVFGISEAERLVDRYQRLANLDGDLASYAYDDDVLQQLQDIVDQIEQYHATWTADKDFSTVMETLQARHDIAMNLRETVHNIVAMITSAESAYYMGKIVEVEQIAQELEAPMEQRKDARSHGKLIDRLDSFVRFGNMTPYYFKRAIDNAGLTHLMDDVEKAEARWGLGMPKIKEKLDALKEKHHYYDWDNDEKFVFADTLRSDVTYELTREQAMSLLAIWNREQYDETFRSFHLAKGGFVFPDQADDKTTSQRDKRYGIHVSEMTIGAITNWLTPDQLAYVDDVVKYLSTEMSALGNETSMLMHGIKKYKEKYYFPIQVYGGNLKIRSDAGSTSTTRDSRVANAGFTKARMRQSTNAVVLTDFTETAAGHAQKMLTYATFAPSIEAINKVLNIKTLTSDGTETTIYNEFGLTYGTNALTYLLDYLKALNGGVNPDRQGGLLNSLLSNFKKMAVVGSVSVAAKQPMSIIRAATMINPRYLTQALAASTSNALLGNRRHSFEEAKKYAGTAVIKDIGKFDAGVGMTNVEWLLDRDDPEYTFWRKAKEALNVRDWEAFKARWNAILGFLPEQGDSLTWGVMWQAVKLEQHAEHPSADVHSKEFLEMCGERFDTVMRATQVYDSTVTKAPNLRSTDGLMKMASAFMNEPTLTVNMLYDAFSHMKDVHIKDKINPAAAGAAVLISGFAQAFITSLFSALRNGDDDKTLSEKMSETLLENFRDEINPLNMLPVVKDIVSVLEGGDVERSDMTVFSDFVSNLQRLANGKYDFTNPKDLYRAVEDAGGSIAKLFGVPLKNIMRELRTVATVLERSSKRVSGQEEWTNWRLVTANLAEDLHVVPEKFAGFTLIDKSTQGYIDKLYGAMRTSDTKRAEELTEYLTEAKGITEESITSKLRTKLKADYVKEGISLDDAIDFAIRNKLWKDEKTAYGNLITAADRAQHADVDDYSTTAYVHVYNALLQGDRAAFGKAVSDMVGHGYAEKTVKSNAKSQIASWYKDGELTKQQAQSMLSFVGVEGENEIYWLMDEWNYNRDKGEDAAAYTKYVDLYDAIDSGRGLDAAIAELVQHTDKTEKEAKSSAASAITSKYKPQLVELMAAGKKTEAAALQARILTAYEALGYNRAKKLKDIQKWYK